MFLSDPQIVERNSSVEVVVGLDGDVLRRLVALPFMDSEEEDAGGMLLWLIL